VTARSKPAQAAQAAAVGLARLWPEVEPDTDLDGVLAERRRWWHVEKPSSPVWAWSGEETQGSG